MNISDLVPLIIIVGSIVYSIVKNTGKAKQEETAKTTLPGKKEVKLPQEILSQFPEIRQVFMDEPVQKETKKPKKEQGKTHTSYPVHASHHKQASGSRRIAEEEEASYPSFNIDDTDELKKAIIYTEILNRKEY